MTKSCRVIAALVGILFNHMTTQELDLKNENDLQAFLKAYFGHIEQVQCLWAFCF